MPLTEYMCLYTSADGDIIDLNDGVNFHTMEFGGTGMVDPELFADEFPMRDGAVFIDSRLPSRDITIFMVLEGETHADRLRAERRLSRYLSARRGLGTLTLARPDGEVRHIQAIYKSGANWGQEGIIGPTARRVPLVFFCPSPHFYAFRETVLIIDDASGSAPKVNTAFTVDYAGSAPAYPVIQIVGPATNPYVRCTGPDGVTRTVGVTLELTGTQDLFFDFNATPKSIVIDPDTDNLDVMDTVTPVDGEYAEFWELQPGENEILIHDDSGSPSAEAFLTYIERYDEL